MQPHNPNTHINSFVDKKCVITLKYDLGTDTQILGIVTDVTSSGVSIRHGEHQEHMDFVPWSNTVSVRHSSPLAPAPTVPVYSAKVKMAGTIKKK